MSSKIYKARDKWGDVISLEITPSGMVYFNSVTVAEDDQVGLTIEGTVTFFETVLNYLKDDTKSDYVVDEKKDGVVR
jgi:hypothetical protein